MLTIPRSTATTHSHIHRIVRVARLQLERHRRWWSAFGTLLLSLFLSVHPTYAQGGGGGTGTFGTKMEEAATNLTTLGRPFALVAVALAILSFIFEPALPGWARENKQTLRGVLIACIALGAVPDIVGFFFA